MGYSTDFFGSFTLDKPLTAIQIEYLNMFANTRRVKRDPIKLHLMKLEGSGNTRCFELLEELGLPMGGEGDFYCGTGYSGQDGGSFNSSKDNSVVDYNSEPSTQCGLWCQWNPSDDGTEIVWDGSEKFYHYIEWLEYLIATFLKPWGYKVNGIVEWQGEDRGDTGVIEVVDNVVTTHEGKRRSDFNPIPKATLEPVSTKPVAIAFDDASEIVLDLIKLRNELSSSKKGTAVACKKLDELIHKYGV